MHGASQLVESSTAQSQQRPVPVRHRLYWYFGAWLVLVLFIELVVGPDGATVTDQSELTQRLLMPLWAPLMVMLGLTFAVSGLGALGGANNLVMALMLAYLVVQLALTLGTTERRTFIALMVVHTIALAVGMTAYLWWAAAIDG